MMWWIDRGVWLIPDQVLSGPGIHIHTEHLLPYNDGQYFI